MVTSTGSTSSPTQHRTIETWVDGPSGPVWAAVHRPATDTTNGVVVIAGSVGLEAVTMHRAMYRLGYELAQRGLVAIRFSWTGDGDSVGLDPETSPVDAWRADLDAVLRLARSLAPGAPVHLVSTRLGACVEPTEPVDSLTEIEPVGGRMFVRSHTMLRKIGTPVDPVDPEEGIELSGTLWTPDQAAAVRRLKPLATASGHPARVITLPEDQLETFYSVAPQLATTPLDVLTGLADSLASDPTVPLASFHPQRTATFTVDGSTVTEELVEIGPQRLPGVVTRGADTPVNVVVFTAPGAEGRAAPVGLFAQLPRLLATRGSLVVRADRRELGELATTTEIHAPKVHAHDAADDVTETVAFARELLPGARVVAVGACIGAWLFQKTAARTGIDRLVAIESIAWDPDPDSYQWVPGTYEVAYGGKRFAAGLRTPPSMGDASPGRRAALLAFGIAKRTAAKGLALAVRHCPAWLWARLADRMIVQDPAAMLAAIPDTTRVDLHSGLFAASVFERSRGIASVQTARRNGKQITMARWPELDHSLFAHRARTLVRDIVLDAARTTR